MEPCHLLSCVLTLTEPSQSWGNGDSRLDLLGLEWY